MSKLSDHLPQFLIMQDVISKPPKKDRTTKDLSTFCEQDYRNDIERTTLTHPEYSNVSSLFGEFHRHYQDVIEKHVPTVTLSVKEFSFKQKPWITREIQRDIRIKNKYSKKYSRTKQSIWSIRYRDLNRKVRKDIFESKKKYYSEYFSNNLRNLKKVWSGLNELISQKKKQNVEEIFLNDEDGICTDQKKVADSFNHADLAGGL